MFFIININKYKCFILTFILCFISIPLYAQGDDSISNSSQNPMSCVKTLIKEKKDTNADNEPVYRAVANVSRVLVGVLISNMSVQDSLSRQLSASDERMLEDVIQSSMDAITTSEDIKDVTKEYSLLQKGFAALALAIKIEHINIQNNTIHDPNTFNILYTAIDDLIKVYFETTGRRRRHFDKNTLSQLQADIADIAVASLTEGASTYEDTHPKEVLMKRAISKAISTGDFSDFKKLLEQGVVIQPIL